MASLSEKFYAICIGVNSCPQSLRLQTNTLDYAEKDAEAVYNLLIQTGIPREQCCLLTGPEATLDAINKNLGKWIVNIPRRNDVVLFYFAGHGVPLLPNDDETEDSYSEVFLAPYDFNEQKILEDRNFRRREALGLERIRDNFFLDTRSNKVLFIFDSCYSGDFFGPKYRGEEENGLQTYIKSVFARTSAGARVALSSCLSSQRARENKKFGHGLFTYHLLEALRGDAIDALDMEGYLTVNSLFSYLCKNLPKDQCPVRSGVEQGEFQLIHYPEKRRQSKQADNFASHSKISSRENQLRTLLADHSAFLLDRLESFVGREQELGEIRQHIHTMLSTGGYLTITGQAGQGKSSIIAKLVEESQNNQVACHFIPFNPGPDHQINLLRNLMAHLILKYHLLDIYVSSENRSALRDYFPKILTEIAARGKQEVIFIDGLDQLKAEINGERDLSFLPNNPPPGIVFVLGTRPNDTLKSINLLKPHVEYKLSEVSREDFDLILQHREVLLDTKIVDQFYLSMQANALYLDLAAKGLRENKDVSAQDMIVRIADNPENLFSLTIDRLRHPLVEWREVIKPVLGVLLSAREPLSVHAIRQVLNAEDERLREGIIRLGGLLAEDGKHQYSLFHLKLYDYLRQDIYNPAKDYVFAADEEAIWHQKFVKWCEQDDLSIIWQDKKHDLVEQKRRNYARQHYIEHIYYARAWQKLFEVLDAGEYGHAKVSYDLGIRLYAQDLELGRLAAVSAEHDINTALTFLPHLWRYTLLQCSLTSYADQYPPEAFQILVQLKQSARAIGLAELLTSPTNKAKILTQIAETMAAQKDDEDAYTEVLLRAAEVGKHIYEQDQQAKVLEDIGMFFAQIGHWEQAEHIILCIEDIEQRAEVLAMLGEMLAWSEQQEQSQRIWLQVEQIVTTYIIPTIKDSEQRAGALFMLAKALNEAGITSHASHIWQQVENLIIKEVIQQSEENKQYGSEALLGLSERLAEAHHWEQAEQLILLIGEKQQRTNALTTLGKHLAEAHHWKQAEQIILALDDSKQHDETLVELTKQLAQEKKWQEIERILLLIERNEQRIEALNELAEALTEEKDYTYAHRIWQQIVKISLEEILPHVTEEDEHIEYLENLSDELSKSQQWNLARHVILNIKDYVKRNNVLFELYQQVAKVHQWEHAENIIASIDDSSKQAEALINFASALTKAKQQERANNIWQNALRIIMEDVIPGINDKHALADTLTELGEALCLGKQWIEARQIIFSIQIPEKREIALITFISELSKSKRWYEAEQLIVDIHSYQQYVLAQAELGRQLTHAGHWEDAERIIYAIEERYLQSATLAILGKELTSHGYPEQAKKIWQCLEENVLTSILPDLPLSEKRLALLTLLGETMAESGEWERAKQIICTIEERKTRDMALTSLCKQFAENTQWEHWEQVERLIYIIEERQQRATAQVFLSKSLVHANRWEDAERFISTIEENERKDEALLILSEGLAKSEHWVKAEQCIQLFTNTRVRTNAQITLANLLIEADHWQEAKRVILHITDDAKQRAQALANVARVLIKAEYWSEAQKIWTLVEEILRNTQDDTIKDEILESWQISLASTRPPNDEELNSIEFEEISPIKNSRIFKSKAQKLAKSLGLPLPIKRYVHIHEMSKLALLEQLLPDYSNLQEGAHKFRTNDITRTVPFLSRTTRALPRTTGIPRRRYPARVRTPNSAYPRSQSITRELPTTRAGRVVRSTFLSSSQATEYSYDRDFSETDFIEYTDEIYDDKDYDDEDYDAYEGSDPEEQSDEDFAAAMLPSRRRYNRPRRFRQSPLNLRYYANTNRRRRTTGDFPTVREIESLNLADGLIITNVLCALGLQIYSLGRKEEALGIWDNVEKTIETIRSSSIKGESLKRLALTWAQIGMWDKSKTLIERIEKATSRSHAMYEFAIIAIKVHQWEQAKQAIHDINNTYWQCKLFNKLAKTLTKEGQIEQAETIWKKVRELTLNTMQIEAEHYKHPSSDPLRDEQLELGYEEEDNTEDPISYEEEDDAEDLSTLLAKTLLQLSTDTMELDLQFIQTFVLENKDFEKKQLFSLLQEEAKYELSKSLMDVEQWNMAEDVISSIVNDERRAKALYRLATTLSANRESESRKKERILCLVQTWWKKAEKREQALHLLPLAYLLLHFKPEMGFSLYQAFDWVDKFLIGG